MACVRMCNKIRAILLLLCWASSVRIAQAGKLVNAPNSVVYSAGEVSVVDHKLKVSTLWQSSPRLFSLQCAALSSDLSSLTVLGYSLLEDTDYVQRYSLVDGRAMGSPLVVHQSSGQSQKQRLALFSDQYLLLYSPAGQTLLAYDSTTLKY